MSRKILWFSFLLSTVSLLSQTTVIDSRSYNLGVIGAFSEVVGLGIKNIALSSPLSPGDMEALLDDAVRIAKENGAEIYLEKEFLVTDLFSESVTRGKHVLVIYTGSALEAYFALKNKKEVLLQSGRYKGADRRRIAVEMGRLLSYPDAKIDALLRARTIEMDWAPVDTINAHLPAGIRLFAGKNDALPLKAWYVSIEETDPRILTRVAVSDDPDDGKETVSRFAERLGACVAVNGGYFRMDLKHAEHVGLLVSRGSTIAPATSEVVRDAVTYPTARAAIGFSQDDCADIAWVISRNDSLFALTAPYPNVPGRPSPGLSNDHPRFWNRFDAIGAGPSLLSDSKVRITSDEEVFFGSSIPDIHPRSAVGIRADGTLLVLVVDGRQPESRGVDLEELARLLLELGAMEGMNLDGGGSSTLVVNGQLINRPAGGIFQREVVSALVTFFISE